MAYKALVSFSGLVSMTVGEVAEIRNPSIVTDLLRAGYIEEVKTETKVEKPKVEKPKVEKVEPKPRKKRTPKGG